MGPKRKNTSDGATTEATATKKSKAGNASEDAPAGEAASADNTALHFFKNQHYGSKGIRAELKRAAELGPFRMDASKYYQFFEAQDALDPLRDTYKSRLSRDTAYEWLWLGVSNANILVYGVGDKRLLLDDFMSNFLQGEDVLELTGNPNPGYANDLHSNVSLKSAKAVLIGIAEKYLKLENLETVISENLLTFARNITGKQILILTSISC